MKKVILTFVLLGAITTANAKSSLLPVNCHAVACQYLESVENMYGEVDDPDFFYNYAYKICLRQQ